MISIYYLLIFVSLIVALLIYLLIKSIKTNQIYEDTIEQYSEKLLEFRKAAYRTLTEIRKIDHRSMFEKDDDVGIIFKKIVELVDGLDKELQILIKEYAEDGEEEKEKK